MFFLEHIITRASVNIKPNQFFGGGWGVISGELLKASNLITSFLSSPLPPICLYKNTLKTI